MATVWTEGSSAGEMRFIGTEPVTWSAGGLTGIKYAVIHDEASSKLLACGQCSTAGFEFRSGMFSAWSRARASSG